MSVQIITSVAICHDSHITLHYNNVFEENKMFLTLNIPNDVRVTISISIFSHNQHTIYEIFYASKSFRKNEDTVYTQCILGSLRYTLRYFTNISI